MNRLVEDEVGRSSVVGLDGVEVDDAGYTQEDGLACRYHITVAHGLHCHRNHIVASLDKFFCAQHLHVGSRRDGCTSRDGHCALLEFYRTLRSSYIVATVGSIVFIHFRGVDGELYLDIAVHLLGRLYGHRIAGGGILNHKLHDGVVLRSREEQGRLVPFEIIAL